MGSASPFESTPRRTSWQGRKLIQQKVDRMLLQGVIKKSTSPWSSPVVSITKRIEVSVFPLTSKRLNKITRKKVYLLSFQEDLLRALGNADRSTKFDCYRGFWQVPAAEEDKPKTAICTEDGLNEFLRMPFGLCKSPATFQLTNNVILTALKWAACLVYLDAIVISSNGFQEQLPCLSLVPNCAPTSWLTLQPKNCSFAMRELNWVTWVTRASPNSYQLPMWNSSLGLAG